MNSSTLHILYFETEILLSDDGIVIFSDNLDDDINEKLLGKWQPNIYMCLLMCSVLYVKTHIVVFYYISHMYVKFII